MFGAPLHDFDFETKTKHGISKLELMCKFLPVIHGENCEEDFDKFKLWINEQIKRDMTDLEELNMLYGASDFIRSDPGTNERNSAMKYLFNAEFLDEPVGEQSFAVKCSLYEGVLNEPHAKCSRDRKSVV